MLILLWTLWKKTNVLAQGIFDCLAFRRSTRRETWLSTMETAQPSKGRNLEAPGCRYLHAELEHEEPRSQIWAFAIDVRETGHKGFRPGDRVVSITSWSQGAGPWMVSGGFGVYATERTIARRTTELLPPHNRGPSRTVMEVTGHLMLRKSALLDTTFWARSSHLGTWSSPCRRPKTLESKWKTSSRRLLIPPDLGQVRTSERSWEKAMWRCVTSVWPWIKEKSSQCPPQV